MFTQTDSNPYERFHHHSSNTPPLTGPLVHPAIPDETYAAYLSIVRQGVGQTTNAKRVIVIGAGMAGLTAAYELLRAGHRPIILEAGQRVGGRCYTLREPFADGLIGEAGAMRFPSSHKLVFAYLDKFQIAIQKFSGFNPDSPLFVGGKRERIGQVLADPDSAPSRVTSLWNQAIDPILAYYLREQKQGNNVWPEIAERYQHCSLRDFLVESGWSAEEIATFGVVGFGRGGMGAMMGISFLEIFRHSLSHGTEYRVVGGTDELPRRILHAQPQGQQQTLAGHIRYGAKVTAIHQDQAGVRVEYITCGGKQQIFGDEVLVTIPFPQVRKIAVTPDFSPSKQRAINELHYTASTKIFLQCKSRFWERYDPEWRTGGLLMTDLPVRNIYFPGPEQGAGRNVILASYTWEADAQGWATLAPAERVQRAVAAIAEIYPEIVEEVEVGASCDWNDPHRHTGGAFALYAPGQMALYDDIVKAEGRIHFAGEHTSQERGWVEGAIESGLREALAIHQKAERSSDSRTRQQIHPLPQPMMMV